MARLEALTTGQLLDRIFTLYRKNFVLFFTIAAIPQLASIIPSAAVLVLGPKTMWGFVGVAVVQLIAFIVFLALIAASQGATTMAVSDVYLDRPTSVKTSFQRVSGMTARLIGMMLGYALLVGIGSIFLIVPGIYFLITYALATAVMAIERVSFSEAMTRSKDLVVGNRTRIVVIFLLSLAISIAAALILDFPAELIAGTLKGAPLAAQLLRQLGSAAASALSTPIGLIGFTLAYYDARVRKEAFDLEYMMESDAAAAVPAAVPPAPIVAGVAAGATTSGAAGDTIAASTGGSTFMLFDQDNASPAPAPAPTKSSSGPTEG